ncbi:hypothetical protein WSK_4289 [Novosphingobium sp. Rr 2-17]|nr:hypothetical protein WSK_4289 [Novosphingobium sp. Rr 2-17]
MESGVSTAMRMVLRQSRDLLRPSKRRPFPSRIGAGVPPRRHEIQLRRIYANAAWDLEVKLDAKRAPIDL